MAFATDRDLLVFEPALFRDVAWAGQTLAAASDASIAGDTLTSASSDFIGAGVDAGHVALVGGAALEVIERTSATTLVVSRLRDSIDDPPLRPLPATGAALRIATFGPQIAIVHQQTLRLLGIDPLMPESPAETDILNPRGLARVEALGALHLILSAAAAGVSDDSPLWAKAALYRDRMLFERRTAAALIDLDGDGQPDAIRRLSASRLIRA